MLKFFIALADNINIMIYVEKIENENNLISDILSWFIYDNDFGREGLSISIDNKEITISSIEDFMKNCELLTRPDKV